MFRPTLIQVYEYDRLVVGKEYEAEGRIVKFRQSHLDTLAKYITANQGCQFYTLYYDRVKFNQFVGVIQVDDLTIEVLPKTDRHDTKDKERWQQALIQMLHISLQVEAKTTTTASINIKKLNVLEAYLVLFLEEVSKLMRAGLVKKYRNNISNQTTLKGRLLVHQHVTRNIVHAERFYVNHQVYDRDNIYNSILREALDCINQLSVSSVVRNNCSTILLDFPQCRNVSISEKLFSQLRYDRKTRAYKTAIQLAKIILLNYHPDLKGGRNNILAIMVDMNLLWENYIYFSLKKSCNRSDRKIRVQPQQKRPFWQHSNSWPLKLKPDLFVEGIYEGKPGRFILDTKWKYQSKPSVEDIRQMYAYNQFFETEQSYLLYPDKLEDSGVTKHPGDFYRPGTNRADSELKCGLMYADLMDEDGKLNLDIGLGIIDCLFCP